jgi:hypothetical protein
MCLKYTLIRFSPPSFLPHHPSPVTSISTSFITLFSYTNTKYILPPSHFPFTFPLLLPLVRTYLIFLFFICSRRFCLGISDMKCLKYFNVWHTLIRLTPSITSSLLPCSPIIQQVTAHCIILSSYTDALCVNIIHSLSFSFSLLHPHHILQFLFEPLLEQLL